MSGCFFETRGSSCNGSGYLGHSESFYTIDWVSERVSVLYRQTRQNCCSTWRDTKCAYYYYYYYIAIACDAKNRCVQIAVELLTVCRLVLTADEVATRNDVFAEFPSNWKNDKQNSAWVGRRARCTERLTKCTGKQSLKVIVSQTRSQ